MSPFPAKPSKTDKPSAGAPATLTPTLRFPEFSNEPGWKVRPLADEAQFHKGRGIAKSEVEPNGRRACIRYGELYTRYGEVITGAHSRTNAVDAELFLSRVNDVIIPASGETKEDIATASCVMLDGVALGSDLNVLRTRHNGVFLSYLINGTKRREIAKVAQGDTVVHLYPSQLEKVTVAFPMRAEQQKIADCLMSLDEAVAAQERKVEALKAHKKGLMQHLFPQEGQALPRLRFPEFRDGPEWETSKLDSLAKRGTGHTPDKAHPEYYNGGVKWVSLADSSRLDQGLIDKTEREISALGIDNSSAVLHAPGSVLLSRDAGIGKSAVMKGPMAVSQHFIVWTCHLRALNNWFLYYTLQGLKPLFERIATGSTIKTIGMPFFADLVIVHPQLAEQRRVADCLGSLDAALDAASADLAALKTHKKGLMQGLFPSVRSVDDA